MRKQKAQPQQDSGNSTKLLLAEVLAALDTAKSKEELIAIRKRAWPLPDAEFDEFNSKFTVANDRFLTEDEKRERRAMAESLWQRLRQNFC